MLINFLRSDETPDSGQIAPHFRLHVFAAMVSVTNCDVSGDQILRANRIFNNIAFSASKTQKYMVKDRWQSICGSCTAVASSCPWVPGTPSETLSASPECPEWSYRWYINWYNVNPSHLQLLLQLCVPAGGVPGRDCQQHLHQTCEQCLTMESTIFGGGHIKKLLIK